MARGGLFHFGQADDTEEDYMRRKQKEALEKKGPTPNRPRPEDLGSGAAKKAGEALESRAEKLKRMEREYGI